MEVGNFSKLLRKIRKTPGFLSTAILVVLFGLLGPAEMFQPYDWFQQSISAQINTKPYNGDAVLVEIDEEALERFESNAITRGQLAQIVRQIDAAGPKQLIVDSQYFEVDTPQGSAELEQALKDAKRPPIMTVDLAIDSIGDLRDVRAHEGALSSPEETTAALGQAVPDGAVVGTAIIFSSPIGAHASIPFSIEHEGALFPSVPQLMAEYSQPFGNIYFIDLSYDPATIPKLNAADVYEGRFDPGDIAGKQAVISSNYNLIRDTGLTPQGSNVSESQMIVLAAQTLIDGPPTMVGWLPSYIFAALAAFALVFMRSPRGRIVAITALLIIVLSPILLERYLIYQNTSTAVFLLIFVGLSRLWSNFRAVLKASRSAAETKSRFLTQASHDLRQPIHAIGMLAERLGQTDLTVEQSALVKKINWSVEGAGRMFQSLLDVAKIESGSLKANPTPVSVNELLAEIDGQNAMAADQAGVTLRLVPSDLVLFTDRVLTLTVLQNLVSNSIKYATGKKVLIGCRRKGDRAALCVYDKGKGISQEELQHVSKEFYRASGKSSGTDDGTGLGLAIVQRLAALMGQTVSIRSVPDKGTGVVVSGFRLTDKSPQVRTAAQTSEVKPLHDLRVVVADDEIETLRATEALLEQWGCSVTAFDELPAEAVECDALLTDFDFGMGKTLADYDVVLDKFIDRGAAVIVLTGHHPDEVEQVIKGKSEMILAKPIRPAELRSVLMSVRMERR